MSVYLRKSFFTLLVLALLISTGGVALEAKAAATGDLLITGVIDATRTGGTPKAIEVYVVNNIADLSIYGLGSANNGGGTDGEEFTFQAVPATAGDFIYVASETTEFTNWFGFAPDYTTSAASINGDDAVELFQNGTVVDVFGDINTDGSGQPWEYMDGWAYRVDETGADGSTFVLANWTFSSPNALDGETDNATAATPFPTGSYSPGGGGDVPPTVASTTPANLATDVALDADIDINFSEDVTVTGSWYDITCVSSGTHSVAVTGGSQNYTLNPDTNFSAGESCTVTVYAAQVADQDLPADNMAADYTFDFTAFTPACGTSATFIHDIQGSGSDSPEEGNLHTIEGVVVGDFQTSDHLKGFFVQEEDADADSDPTTSEGIFVYDGSSPAVDVSVGDIVRVDGTVDEQYGLTQLESVTQVEICPAGGSATAATVTLPIADLADWENYEGMLINIPQTLYATGNYNQGRYGEVDLSVTDRLYTPTNVVAPGATANTLQDLNDRSRIQLEDGSTTSNPDPMPYLGTGNTLRSGDTLSSITGVLNYSFGAYELHPTGTVSFTRSNPRTTAPASLGGTFKVASFNVLNYFSTLDGSGAICGPAANQNCRGADNATEFTRQRDKIIAAIIAMDADVIGLMELENHATDNALADLVSGLNDSAGAGTYAAVNTGPIGTDAIKVAFIYKTATVSETGDFKILDSSVDATFNDDKNRPALAQTFTATESGEVFTVAVNHLKSKGSNCDSLGDPDTGDGQGNCNLTRASAATALVNWLDTDPTGSGDADFLIIGDLNSYAMEDPITAIKNGGYTDLLQTLANPYSYIYYGQSGYLDHALANAGINAQITGVTSWHINTDEPLALDYNTEYNLPALYDSGVYRASDHDPIVIGLNFVQFEAPATRWTTAFDYNHGWRVDSHPRMFADVNGDGYDDAVGFGLDGVYVALSDGSTFAATATKWTSAFDYNHDWRVDSHPRMFADVDGDGNADAVGFGIDGIYVALSDGSSFDANATRWTTAFDYNHGWRVDSHPRMFADVDGDGDDDAVGFGIDGIYVALSNGNSFTTSPSLWTTAFSYDDGWRVDSYPRMLADVNGDGNADAVGFGVDGIYVALSDGASFASTATRWTTALDYNHGWRVDSHPRMFADVNNDGFADAIGFGLDGVYVVLSKRTTFTTAATRWTTAFDYNHGWRVDSHPRMLADLNGDGKFDAAGFGIDGIYTTLAE